jgi:acyl-CoA dehydrogenase
MLKVQATTMLEFCAREAAQIFGGASYELGTKIERIYREVRVLAIGGGSEEVMRDLAARQLGL